MDTLEAVIDRVKKAGNYQHLLDFYHRFSSLEDMKADPNAPGFALLFASLVLKGPWPEVEEMIRRNGESAYDYAICVLNKNHDDAERWVVTGY